jgi:hypothetical protein
MLASNELALNLPQKTKVFLFHHGAGPICQKHQNYSSAYSKNEQCCREEIPTVATAARVTRVNEAALSEVEGFTRWSVGGLVTLLVPHSAHEAPRRQRGLPIRAYPLPLPDSGEVCG